jgi:hypothetical protein
MDFMTIGLWYVCQCLVQVIPFVPRISHHDSQRSPVYFMHEVLYFRLDGIIGVLNPTEVLWMM